MRAFKWSILVSMVLASGAVLAYPGDEPEWDVADVISAEPIMEYVSEPRDRQVCWSEPVEYREPVRRGRSSNGSAVVGALLGGLIGNQFGSGHGRDAATVAGAAIGYSAGKDEQRRSDYRNGRYVERVVRTEEQRCRVETDYDEQERIVGYDVAYRYNGRIRHTRTIDDPGDTIQVRVDVQPMR